jgi:hypothetical protein
MKTKFSSLLAVAAVAVTMASTASATLTTCDTGISNVVGATCTEGTLTFSNFTVNPGAGFNTAAVGIVAAPSTAVVGADVDLAFQIGGLSGSGVTNDLGDIELQYEVTGGLNGVDIILQASPNVNIPGGAVVVTEVACTAAFVSGVCSGETLANYSVSSSGGVAMASQVPWLTCGAPGAPSTPNCLASLPYSGPVYIKKDLAFDGATTSELVNSHVELITAPEPVTLSLMGFGLLGLGLMGRRLRK